MTLTVTPTGERGLALGRLRSLAAASATLQALVGAANATDALPYIHVANARATITRPLFVAMYGDQYGRVRFAEGNTNGGGFYRTRTGTNNLYFLIELNVHKSTAITQAAGTATGTATAHGYVAGMTVEIIGSAIVAYNGVKTILTVPTANTFTFAIASGTASPATGASIISKPDDDGDCAILFGDKTDAIMAEMEAASGGGALIMTAYKLHRGPSRTDVSERTQEGDYYQEIYEIMWGE